MDAKTLTIALAAANVRAPGDEPTMTPDPRAEEALVLPWDVAVAILGRASPYGRNTLAWQAAAVSVCTYLDARGDGPALKWVMDRDWIGDETQEQVTTEFGRAG